MIQTGCYLLVVSDPDRAQEFLDRLEIEDCFSESVRVFRFASRDRLVAMLSLSPGQITHVARAKRGKTAATTRQRLNLFGVMPVTPFQAADLAAALPKGLQSRMALTLRTGGLIQPKMWAHVEEAIAKVSLGTADALKKLAPFSERALDGLDDRARENLALEHEAAAIAMRLAGFDDNQREHNLGWRPRPGRAPLSFLDGLGAIPLREDAMIMNDMQRVPGFERLDHTKFGAVAFENDATKLIVIHANHQKLEEALGVDLIYYNETFKYFVCVQYKAMEAEASGAVFRFPQEDLRRELARMDRVLALLRPLARCPDPHSFRLSDNPFFLKFCPRVDFDPDRPDLIRGMYLPLDLWRRLEKHECTLGPRKGRVLTFENAGRHLDNTSFISLVSKGWIGSDAEHSAVLADLVKAILVGRRSLVMAVKIDKKDPPEASVIIHTLGTGGIEVEDAPRQQVHACLTR